MRWAEAEGARLAHDGWGMLVEQAAESFALWTGTRPATGDLLRRRLGQG
jgi:shikimate dehydrogenase